MSQGLPTSDVAGSSDLAHRVQRECRSSSIDTGSQRKGSFASSDTDAPAAPQSSKLSKPRKERRSTSSADADASKEKKLSKSDTPEDLSSTKLSKPKKDRRSKSSTEMDAHRQKAPESHTSSDTDTLEGSSDSQGAKFLTPKKERRSASADAPRKESTKTKKHRTQSSSAADEREVGPSGSTKTKPSKQKKDSDTPKDRKSSKKKKHASSFKDTTSLPKRTHSLYAPASGPSPFFQDEAQVSQLRRTLSLRGQTRVSLTPDFEQIVPSPAPRRSSLTNEEAEKRRSSFHVSNVEVVGTGSRKPTRFVLTSSVPFAGQKSDNN